MEWYVLVFCLNAFVSLIGVVDPRKSESQNNVEFTQCHNKSSPISPQFNGLYDVVCLPCPSGRFMALACSIAL